MRRIKWAAFLTVSLTMSSSLTAINPPINTQFTRDEAETWIRYMTPVRAKYLASILNNLPEGETLGDQVRRIKNLDAAGSLEEPHLDLDLVIDQVAYLLKNQRPGESNTMGDPEGNLWAIAKEIAQSVDGKALPADDAAMVGYGQYVLKRLDDEQQRLNGTNNSYASGETLHDAINAVWGALNYDNPENPPAGEANLKDAASSLRDLIYPDPFVFNIWEAIRFLDFDLGVTADENGTPLQSALSLREYVSILRKRLRDGSDTLQEGVASLIGDGQGGFQDGFFAGGLIGTGPDLDPLNDVYGKLLVLKEKILDSNDPNSPYTETLREAITAAADNIDFGSTDIPEAISAAIDRINEDSETLHDAITDASKKIHPNYSDIPPALDALSQMIGFLPPNP